MKFINGSILHITWQKRKECTVGKPQGGAMIPGKVICWALVDEQQIQVGVTHELGSHGSLRSHYLGLQFSPRHFRVEFFLKINISFCNFILNYMYACLSDEAIMHQIKGASYRSKNISIRKGNRVYAHYLRVY